jgi:hypothetical protein
MEELAEVGRGAQLCVCVRCRISGAAEEGIKYWRRG